MHLVGGGQPLAVLLGLGLVGCDADLDEFGAQSGIAGALFLAVAKPFCRQASNTVTATAFDKFTLRWPDNIGSRRRCDVAKVSRNAGGRPCVSEPNTSQSPASKRAS